MVQLLGLGLMDVRSFGSDRTASEGVATSHRYSSPTSTNHPVPLIGEPGWLIHVAGLNQRVGVLTFEPFVSFDGRGNPQVTEDFGAPRFHPVMMSEFGVNVMLLQTTDAVAAVMLAMVKLLSFAGRRDRVHGVTIDNKEKFVDPAHVRTDIGHGRNHVTLVPTRCITPPDFTLDKLVDAMNPDRPMMEQLMRDGALNGWTGDAQRLFDEIGNRPEWAHEQAEAGLAQLVQLGLIALPESDVPVVHPAHFGQMPAGMVSSVAQTMDSHAERSTLLDDDGTIDGTKIKNAQEPGTTQGSKRKKPRSLSKNQRLQRRVEERDLRIATLIADNEAKNARIAELELMLIEVAPDIDSARFSDIELEALPAREQREKLQR